MRWKCTVAYEGTSFAGWQSQPGGNTVQDVIESRLGALFAKRVVIHGSGRTDSGVHARGQVFHFDADWRHGPQKLLQALRTGIPPTIQVHRAEAVADTFHARFSARRKGYHYHYYEGYADPFTFRYRWSLGNRCLDAGRMNAAAAELVGRHDFAAFSANPGEEREDGTVRTLFTLRVEREGRCLRLVAEADGFLFRMVRSLAGCLGDVGSGKLEPAQVREILDTRERTNLVQTAPAEGLFLDSVVY